MFFFPLDAFGPSAEMGFPGKIDGLSDDFQHETFAELILGTEMEGRIHLPYQKRTTNESIHEHVEHATRHFFAFVDNISLRLLSHATLLEEM